MHFIRYKDYLECPKCGNIIPYNYLKWIKYYHIYLKCPKCGNIDQTDFDIEFELDTSFNLMEWIYQRRNDDIPNIIKQLEMELVRRYGLMYVYINYDKIYWRIQMDDIKQYLYFSVYKIK